MSTKMVNIDPQRLLLWAVFSLAVQVLRINFPWPLVDIQALVLILILYFGQVMMLSLCCTLIHLHNSFEACFCGLIDALWEGEVA